jgi:PKD domain-containing protein
MATFVLRNIDDTLWLRVRAKAAAEGVTIKTLVLTSLAQYVAILVLMLFSTACAYHAPAAPTGATAKADASTPASLSLTAASTNDRMTVTAFVTNAGKSPLAGVAVQFSTQDGTLAPESALTGSDGTATTAVIAARTATVNASAGTLATKIQIAPPSSTGVLAVTMSVAAVTVGSTTSISASVANAGVGTPAFAWTFGDGASDHGTFTSVSHAYKSTGSFPVTVTVTDREGRTANATGSARVNAVPPPPPPPPPPGPSYTVLLTATPNATLVNVPVTLTAAVTSANGAPPATSFAWDCGDGRAVENGAITHDCTYTTDGTITPRVTVSSSTATGTASTSVTVSPLPQNVGVATCTSQDAADLSAASTTQCTVRITKGGVDTTAAFTSFEWTFGGDGPDPPAPGSSTAAHRFTIPGSHSAHVNASGPSPLAVVTATSPSFIIGPPPALTVTVHCDPIVGFKATCVASVSDATGIITGELPAGLKYDWDSGDGDPTHNLHDVSNTATFTYLQQSTPTVAVTATALNGSKGQGSTTVTVKELP